MEEKIIAVNRKHLEERDFKQLFNNIGYINTFFIIAFLVLGICAVVVATFYNMANIRLSGLWNAVSPVIVAFLLLLILRMISPRLLASVRYKQYQMIREKSEDDRRLVFYETRFATKIGDTDQSSFEYKDIKSVRMTKDLLIIRLPHQIYSVMRLDGFIQGSAESVYTAIVSATGEK